MLNELQNFIIYELFVEFKKSLKQLKWNSFSSFVDFKDAMSTYVFRWLLFIDVVARFKSETNKKIDNIEKYLTILFVFCHLLHFRKSSNFQIMFTLYLYHDNVRKRIINFLCSFELTSSYKIMKNYMNKIHKKRRLMTYTF